MRLPLQGVSETAHVFWKCFASKGLTQDFGSGNCPAPSPNESPVGTSAYPEKTNPFFEQSKERNTGDRMMEEKPARERKFH
ncbi:hypothetical protein BTUL_0053g00450 [Botrytis tulipae]|uniref:Uncharacterized protein n=1 Tax=Botrytis tulipae TaxID=87230 RepID=A0A4Z1EQ67_9HELO|nr:hypothetical protein BTUL_0053g00450 [Botrytis tulipae]